MVVIMDKKTDVVSNVHDGQYLTSYALLKSLFWHITKKDDCKGTKFEDASFKNEGQEIIGWKCSKCGEKWIIPLRQLRNTMKDSKLREFSGWEFMNILDDLRKILAKK